MGSIDFCYGLKQNFASDLPGIIPLSAKAIVATRGDSPRTSLEMEFTIFPLVRLNFPKNKDMQCMAMHYQTCPIFSAVLSLSMTINLTRSNTFDDHHENIAPADKPHLLCRHLAFVLVHFITRGKQL